MIRTHPQLRALAISCFLPCFLLHFLGCASDGFSSGLGLADAHREYSNSLRWSKFDEASRFVPAEERADFFARMPDFDRVRFTDWKAGPWDPQAAEEENQALIVVTYRGFRMTNPIEFQAQERQLWTREESDGNWRVRSDFSGPPR
jgi:hypothetical protein